MASPTDPPPFPACRHRRRRTTPSSGRLTWLAGEPFRLFFPAGLLWSLVGVLLWPLFYAGELTFHPGIAHARLMIQGFGGALVLGFLGTAGPRMASAPKWTPLELIALFLMHSAGCLLHLRLQHAAGDLAFLLALGGLTSGLLVRVARFRREWPPPQLLLALTGLGCGLVGTLLWLTPDPTASLPRQRLANLLVYQGLLLPPVLGIGSFLFPRLLGGGFGETGADVRPRLQRALLASALLVASFILEAWDNARLGPLLRAGTAAWYLLVEIRWRRAPGDAPRGSLTTGLFWALGLGLTGLLLMALLPERRLAVGHLLYAGGFGLLMLVVASRVVFGHSGELDGFAQRGWRPRLLLFLAVLATLTRASADFFPAILISHHLYAAWTWAAATLFWLLWQRRRLGQRDKSK